MMLARFFLPPPPSFVASLWGLFYFHPLYVVFQSLSLRYAPTNKMIFVIPSRSSRASFYFIVRWFVRFGCLHTCQKTHH